MPGALIVSHDVVGPSMAGAGIRYREMTAALRRRGVAATLAAPNGSPEGLTYSLGDPTLVDLARQHDAIVVTGPILEQFPDLKGLGRPLVVDMYDPFLFENLARRVDVAEHEGGIRTLAEQARCADFFICASERQRDLYIGMLSAAGRVNPTTYRTDPDLRGLIDVVPFGVSPEPPQQGPAMRGRTPGIGSDDRIVVWNGGLWDWFDPTTAIQAVAVLAPSHPTLRLVFLGTRHPNPAIGEPAAAQTARALAADLGLLDTQVFFRDWTPYSERGAFLLEADAALSLHAEGLETRYAYRTRLLDCVWAGLPSISTEGDVLSEQLAHAGLGVTVPVGDVGAVAQAIVNVLSQGHSRPAGRPGFAAMAAQLSWDRAIDPLAAFLANPRRAADRQATAMALPPLTATPRAPRLWERLWPRTGAGSGGGGA